MGRAIAQSVHVMQHSASSRNIPRNRSEGIRFCSGYWTVTFLPKKWRPVTERPSKRSSSASLSSHFFTAMNSPRPSPLSRFPRAGGFRREPVPPRQRLSELREDRHGDEQGAEGPGEPHEALRAARRQQDRDGDHHDVRERERDHPLPAERHQLVESVARESRTEPDVAEEKEPDLRQEPEKRR